MKSRSDITSELYLSKELSSALNKMKPIELRDDLKQEMFICLCGLNDEKFWSIYNNNGLPGLKFWLVRVMLNMIHSTKSNQLFFKHYRNHVIIRDNSKLGHISNKDNLNLRQIFAAVFD